MSWVAHYLHIYCLWSSQLNGRSGKPHRNKYFTSLTINYRKLIIIVFLKGELHPWTVGDAEHVGSIAQAAALSSRCTTPRSPDLGQPTASEIDCPKSKAVRRGQQSRLSAMPYTASQESQQHSLGWRKQVLGGRAWSFLYNSSPRFLYDLVLSILYPKYL